MGIDGVEIGEGQGCGGDNGGQLVGVIGDEGVCKEWYCVVGGKSDGRSEGCLFRIREFVQVNVQFVFGVSFQSVYFG